jgi:hopene-associated glycosyltransferase HpnB
VIWLGAAALLAWLVLLLGRGMFWLGRERDEPPVAEPAHWPDVTILVPARDEAETIATVVHALLAQDYPGRIGLWVVDDRSSDGTGELARTAGSGDARLQVVTGGDRPPSWTGKLWALQQGLEAARPATPYLLFTDADIRHAPDSLRRLVARAEAGGLALTSLMAKLRCESRAERWFIPAFIYFFQMLYPFRWANDPAAGTAAAAGGCVLLRRADFEVAGGLAAIRGAMIDDCSLAGLIKRHKPGTRIWLGLTERVVSLRACPTVEPIRRMVARTAYAQLRYSPVLLLGMLLALTLVFLVPPALAVLGHGWARLLGLAAWAGMALSFAPMLRFYRLSPLRGFALPAVALAYMMFTIDSAIAQYRGRGGMWKGEAGPAPL